MSLVTHIQLCLVALLPICTGVRNQDGQTGKPTGFREISFSTEDNGRIVGALYGDGGEHAVVLAHGAVFNKESWSDLSRVLMKKGFRVLAIDFRGYGKSRAGTQQKALHLDVLGAVRYLRDNGAKRVSVLGGSMGGGASARASVQSKKGEIDSLILLAHVPIRRPQELKGNKLFIVSSGDRLKPRVQQQFEAAPKPKKLVVLDGSAHAQHIFRTDNADKLTKLIVGWLEADKSTNR